MSLHQSKKGGGASAKGGGESEADQEYVDAPASTDVILGKVPRTTHPGNTRYNEILDKFLPHYMAASSRIKKAKIVRDIYDKVTELGRFVKKSSSGMYFVASDSAARSTIGKAIRYRQTLEEQRRMQHKGDSKKAPQPVAWNAQAGHANRAVQLPNNDDERKPPAVDRAVNPSLVSSAGRSSGIQLPQIRRRRSSASFVDPELVQFAFEFDQSEDEAPSPEARAESGNAPSRANEEGSNGSLFSADALDEILSVASAAPSR